MTTHLHIPNSDTEYAVSYFPGFDAFYQSLKEQIGGRSCIIVTDQNVVETSRFLNDDQYDIGEKMTVALKPGEEEKQWHSVEYILQSAFEAGLDRSSVIVAMGGGVVGDLAGFAASIFMRGIPVIQCPTSLLAMVDASVGGKTGYNASFGKNLIGSFHQPEAVLVCHEWLQTLPAVEIQNGICEMVKHGILGNTSHFENLEALAQTCDQQTEKHLETLADLIQDSVQIKAQIVQNDAKESNERMKLNLGHTFGHAIEKLSNYDIPHGQAVAMGTVLAAQYAEKHNICTPKTVDRITSIFLQFGIDTHCPFDEKTLWNEMIHDKKKMGKHLNLILPTDIGNATIHPVTV